MRLSGYDEGTSNPASWRHQYELRSLYRRARGSSSLRPDAPLYKYKQLGGGSHGKVYKVVDLVSGELWAMKEVIQTAYRRKDDWKRHVVQELEIVKRLRHSHVVHFEGSRDVSIDGKFLLLFGLYDGDLRGLIERRNSQCLNIHMLEQPPQEAGYPTLVTQVMGAIDYLFAEKIIHRHIKPENIMVKWDRVRSGWDFFLGDFGIAMTQKAIREKGTFGGPPGYISPEAYKYPRLASFGSDIWSLGVIFLVAMGFLRSHEWSLDLAHWVAKLKVHHYPRAYSDPVHPRCDVQGILQAQERTRTLSQYARVPRAVALMFIDYPDESPGNARRLPGSCRLETFRPERRRFPISDFWDVPELSKADRDRLELEANVQSQGGPSGQMLTSHPQLNYPPGT